VLIFRAASLADNLNSTEFIRYIRKRKFGQKRRSIIVKRRTPIKNEPIITNNDDEHSQEYVSRRRISTINESIKEEEEEVGEREEGREIGFEFEFGDFGGFSFEIKRASESLI